MKTSAGVLVLVLLISALEIEEGSGLPSCDTCRADEMCLLNSDGATWSCGKYVPELLCGRNYLEVGLLVSSLEPAGLDASTAHLADHRCSTHEERNGTVWYQVERKEGSCGNTLQTNGTHATYSNTLFVYPAGERPFSTPVNVPFSCVYPMDAYASLDVAIKPYLELQGRSIVGLGDRARASMSLFHNSNYTEPYPAGRVSLPLGSAMHVGVSVEETETERFVVVLDDCYATHSSNPDDPMRYFLVQNKCPSDRRQVTVDESGSSLQARFSALLFLFQGDYRDVFLHCSLNLCDQMTSSCSPACSKRKARSAPKSFALKPLTIGPITLS